MQVNFLKTSFFIEHPWWLLRNLILVRTWSYRRNRIKTDQEQDRVHENPSNHQIAFENESDRVVHKMVRYIECWFDQIS